MTGVTGVGGLVVERHGNDRALGHEQLFRQHHRQRRNARCRRRNRRCFAAHFANLHDRRQRHSRRQRSGRQTDDHQRRRQSRDSALIVGNSSLGGISSGGTLAPGSGATIGTLNFTNGLTLTNGGVLSETLSGTNVTPGGTNNDLVEVTGSLALTGVTNLNLSFVGGTPSVGSQYEILTYTPGELTGGTGNFKSLNRTIQINTATPGEILAVVTAGGAANLTWNSPSGGSQLWDIDTTSNWFNPALNGGAGGSDFFFQGDNVTFDDTKPRRATCNRPSMSRPR